MRHSETIVLADAHLEALDQELEHFLSFLHSCRTSGIQALYLLGDLFNIWIGTAAMELSHHLPVIEMLQTLREDGISLLYVEGNRDYFLAHRYLGFPFHEIAQEAAQRQFGQHSIYFSHGDLVNLHDRQYQFWRRFSRNVFIFNAFTLLPKRFAVACVHHLERSFRQSNQRHKSAFPHKSCQEYAQGLWDQGYDTIVLGHFHEERVLPASSNHSGRQLITLPAWKDEHRYLSISAQGICAFHHFPD
ncbi:hypothetical protein CSB45_10500 [candidate division KSB3 bacterium]|uniref:Calcineurin-like phosphoesterase domain-containing protein n=1 Tax=candidate division KSB3 bacterium TaxID=2044937 RepID=A0A2G6E3K8_9BACT|nr:MAG: hypothetical protein CSB45_10500 [candidate division KSB3 bacterium]PIE29157.1 MAG: hypothetical protein CSA57_10125 [candidate division KSB3 bacterium]